MFLFEDPFLTCGLVIGAVIQLVALVSIVLLRTPTVPLHLEPSSPSGNQLLRNVKSPSVDTVTSHINKPGKAVIKRRKK